MRKTLFQYLDYKSYLNELLDSNALGGHGVRTTLAHAAKCQLAFLSQVLKGNAHFSLEQVDGISKFLKHSKLEHQYFLTLHQYNRAGTQSLREHFLEELQGLQKKSNKIKENIAPQTQTALSEEDKVIYYRSWLYSAVHIIVHIPKYRTMDAIAKYLGVQQVHLREVLSFLISRGLVANKNDQFIPGKSHVHLGDDSPLIGRHHTHWRVKAIEKAEFPEDKQLQYSSVMSISQEDFTKLRTMLTQTILQSKAIIKDSKDESLCCLNIDFFEVTK